MDSRLPKIAELLELRVTASRTRLRQIAEREARLLRILKDLDSNLEQHLPKPGLATILDYQNDLQLRRWVDQRRVSVNEELAQIKALLSLARADLAKHFARHHAAGALMDREIDHSRKAAQRRIQYDN